MKTAICNCGAPHLTRPENHSEDCPVYDLHRYPEGEVAWTAGGRPHVTDGTGCWCNPTVEQVPPASRDRLTVLDELASYFGDRPIPARIAAALEGAEGWQAEAESWEERAVAAKQRAHDLADALRRVAEFLREARLVEDFARAALDRHTEGGDVT